MSAQTSEYDRPTTIDSIIRRERQPDDSWEATEPASAGETVGRGETELAAVADYIEQLQEAQSP